MVELGVSWRLANNTQSVPRSLLESQENAGTDWGKEEERKNRKWFIMREHSNYIFELETDCWLVDDNVNVSPTIQFTFSVPLGVAQSHLIQFPFSFRTHEMWTGERIGKGS